MDDGLAYLSRREQQIMDVIYERGEATATQVVNGLSDPPSGSAIRALLRILETKGHLGHQKRGRQHVYQPVNPRGRAGRSALRRVLHVFFDGSLENAVATHLSSSGAKVSDKELDRLTKLIRQARDKGR
jgi:BlaI family transcriptional regulator, penicillinase repressor